MASQSQLLPYEGSVSSSDNEVNCLDCLNYSEDEDSTCDQEAITMVIIYLFLALLTFLLYYPSVRDSYSPISAPDSIQVDAVTVSSFDISSSSSSHLTAAWNIDFSFEVDRRRLVLVNLTTGISFTTNGINICSKDLGSYTVEGISRLNKIHVDLVASSVYINRKVAESIISEKNRSGFMHFTLNLKSFLRKSDFSQEEVLMRASCEDIPIKFSGDSGSGCLYRTPLTCTINLYTL
ncbi:hypothetical protein M5689_007690 [Euphorbia peplus]|nr:hypothetical protein M5689_007690 [Euphorbia peplus]